MLTIYSKIQSDSKFNPYMKRILQLFTQKRLGDQLQVESCLEHIEYIIKNSIEETIRKLLPVKLILKDYLETNCEILSW